MLTADLIEQAKQLKGDQKAQAFAAIARLLSEDLLEEVKMGGAAIDRHYGKAEWEHPSGLLVSLAIHRDEDGKPIGFIARVRGNLVPIEICQLGFAYMDPENTKLVLRKAFYIDTDE